MEASGGSGEFTEVETNLHRVFEDAFRRRDAELESLGLKLQLEPVKRRDSGGLYSSSVEATLRWPDGDVHDVFFLQLVDQRRVVADVGEASSWLEDQLADSLANASRRN
jgi:hypothetical protein